MPQEDRWILFTSSASRVVAEEWDVDVLVVGAGPGGGNAALQCSRKGLRTMIIEDHDEIGTPVHCGECISDEAIANLKLDLPEEVISKRVNGIRVIFPDGTSKQLTETGYVLEKHLFEQWIADSAVKEGAKLALKHDALLITFYVVRNDDGINFDLVFESPVKHSTPNEMTQVLNDRLEKQIRKNLGQWLWTHRRWQSPRSLKGES